MAGNENTRIPADLMFGIANPINYHCWYDFVFQLDPAMKEIHEMVRENTQQQMSLLSLYMGKKPYKL